MGPISAINNISTRTTREIKVRPFPDSGFQKMKEWFLNQSWEDIYKAETAHEKAAKFQETLINALENIFPEKILKVNNDDQPWMNNELKLLDRKRKRIYRKERRSERWKYLNRMFKQAVAELGQTQVIDKVVVKDRS